MKKNLKKKKKLLTLIVYFTVRILVVVSLIIQIMSKNWDNVIFCIVALILFTLPDIFDKKLNISLPNTLEVIVYISIYSAAVLGEIQNFYNTSPYWDSILHGLNGFIAAAVGFSLISILNRNENIQITISPAFAILVAFSFSMTIGVLWEFFEYAADRYLAKDMQKDTIVNKITSIKLNPNGENEPLIINNITKTIVYSDNDTKEILIKDGYLDIGINDTMKDLFVNFLGAIIFSIIGYLYVINSEKYRFVEVFIMKKKAKELQT